MEIGVRTVASIVRESELACSEIAGGSYLCETVSHRRWSARIRNHRIDRFARAHYVPLAVRRLHDIQGTAPGKRGYKSGDKQQPQRRSPDYTGH